MAGITQRHHRHGMSAPTIHSGASAGLFPAWTGIATAPVCGIQSGRSTCRQQAAAPRRFRAAGSAADRRRPGGRMCTGRPSCVPDNVPAGTQPGVMELPHVSRQGCRRLTDGMGNLPPGYRPAPSMLPEPISGAVAAGPAVSRVPDRHLVPSIRRRCRRHLPAYIRRTLLFPM